jgi:hypothetical protein
VPEGVREDFSQIKDSTASPRYFNRPINNKVTLIID